MATRFKKGKSGNPKGRKKKQAIDDVRVVIEGVLGEPNQEFPLGWASSNREQARCDGANPTGECARRRSEGRP